MRKLEDIIGWHLELTRRCGLRCPACERTSIINDIDPKQDLNLDEIKAFFNKIDHRKIKYMFFQGNLGDPILYPRFHDISEYFFNCQELCVTTNGLQKNNFWERVLETWPSNSKVILSIDGLSDTNHLYRINSNWSVLEDLFSLISKRKRSTKLIWKFLVFEHNKHQLGEAEVLAKKIGFDAIHFQKSKKIFENESLNGFLKEFWDEESLDIIPNQELSPFCMTGDMHYINALGEYYPCCWTANRIYQNSFKPIPINNNSYEELLSEYNSYAQNKLSWYSCSEVCREKCTKISNKLDEDAPNTRQNRRLIVF